MEGGSDTTSSMILAFIHAMLKYPHVQRKAQKELNDVLHESRSPNWGDYARLPYVAQVVKETMRWRPVTPLSVPHATNAGKCSYHAIGSVY
jgi:cytochrome P450